VLEEGKVEIDYKPIKHVTIIECTQLPLKELTRRVQTMTQLGHPAPLNWAEGVVFLCLPMPLDTNDLVEKMLEGEVVFQSVVYALMPKYDSIIKDRPYDVFVLNQTPNKVLREVAIWLNKHASIKNSITPESPKIQS